MKSSTHDEVISGSILFITTLFLLFYFRGTHSEVSYPILALNWIAVLLIIDYFGRRVIHDSFLPSRTKLQRFVKIAFISFFGGFLLDIFGMFLTKLWVYPYLSLPTYLLIAPIGYITYCLILLSLYMLIKKIMKKPANNKSQTSVKNNQQVMIVEGILAIFFGIPALLYTLYILVQEPINIFAIANNANIVIAWWYPFCIELSILFLFEFLSYKQGKHTLTQKIITKNFPIIVAIIFTNLIGILVIEYVNSLFGLWEFSNWPFENIRVLSIPVVVLLAWQFQLPILLSALNVFLKENELEL